MAFSLFFNFTKYLLTMLHLKHGQWNGLMGDLVNKSSDIDMVLSALRVNADREAAIDFTIPYLESGIAILVAKRTGIISPTAFLGTLSC